MRLLYTCILTIAGLLIAIFSFGQEVQSATITYTPAENGYVLNIPFKWKFINCYGEVHVTITKNSPEITSNTYIYNGKRYTAAELGAEAFAKPECGLTDLTADFYNGSFRLGNVTMGNVIDWFGGCFGQTYHLTKQLGLNDADYKEKLESLSLSNLQLKTCSSRDYKLEGKIQEIEKQNKAKDAMSRADSEFASGDYEKARESYIEALKFDPSNERAKQRLEEVKAKLEAQKDKKAYDEHMKKAEEAMSKGDYETAKSELSKALQKQPGDATAQSKLDDLNEKLSQEKEAEQKAEAATQAAANRRHKGFFWGRNFNSDSYGTATQASNLVGYFRLDYDMWSLSGEPAHRFRFYWEWDDALNTGMPQYVSVLHDTVVMIADLKKYPDLMARWNNIVPRYVEVECEILNFMNGDEYVAANAGEGRMNVVVEVIGRSGQEVEWSLPSSSNWDELFPYCNYMDWGYFRKIGKYKELEEYADQYGSEIAYPKFAFEYSDKIDFYQSHQWFKSKYKELSSLDYENNSSTADIVKIVWPVEEIQGIVREFEEREDRKKEEKMTAEEFWNTPETDKKANGSMDDFWNTPENTTTKKDVVQQQRNREEEQWIAALEPLVKLRREKYEALQNPFIISSPANSSRHSKNVVTIVGKVNKYFNKNSNKAYLNLNGVKQQVDLNGAGEFSNAMVLSNGKNDIQLVLEGVGFSLTHTMTVFYDGVDTDVRATLTWDKPSGDLDLQMYSPSGSLCNYQNKNNQSMSLDVDDTSGYGPENISVINGASGQYRIKVQNYSGGDGAEATVYIYVNEQLVDIKKHTFYSSKEIWEVDTVQYNGH